MEELTKIIELINSLGESAGEAFWVYIGYRLAVSALGYIVLLVAIFVGYKLSFRIVNVVKETSANTLFIQRLRSILGAGSPGYLTDRERINIEKTVQGFVDEKQK
jgi:hypothetical protein